VFIRIVATPPGEAPLEVRRAWIGLELPLAAGEKGPRQVPTLGVLSGPRSLLGRVAALLTGRAERKYGYIIDAPQALVLLAEKAPWAAQWWRECAAHCWQPGYRFMFPAEVCEDADADGPDWAVAADPVASDQVSATRPELTRNPTNKTPSVRKAGQRPMRSIDRRDGEAEGMPASPGRAVSSLFFGLLFCGVGAWLAFRPEWLPPPAGRLTRLPGFAGWFVLFLGAVQIVTALRSLFSGRPRH
jgi:hypothetical protein